MIRETPDILTDSPVSDNLSAPQTDKPLFRPQAVLNPSGIKKKKRKKPFNPTDPEDPDETPEDPDDDDDDGETGNPTDPDDDGGEEDENELKQGEEKKQTTLKQPLQPQHQKPIEKKKEIPQGPLKTERSPWQQMVDFFVHGVRGAQIKNGELPLKPSLADSLLAGFGFKSYKKEILIQEQAQKFWLKKFLGHGEDSTLLNTDLADKRLKKQEEPSLKNIQMETLRREKETRYGQESRLQHSFSEKIMQTRREENRLRAETEHLSIAQKMTTEHLQNTSFQNTKSIPISENPSKPVPLEKTTDSLKHPFAQVNADKTQMQPHNEKKAFLQTQQSTREKEVLAQQQQRMMEQIQMEAQRASMAGTALMAQQGHPMRHPHIHPSQIPLHPKIPQLGEEMSVSTKLVSMEGAEKAAQTQAIQQAQQQTQTPRPPASVKPDVCAIPKGAENANIDVLPPNKAHSGQGNGTLSEAGQRVKEGEEPQGRENQNDSRPR